MHTGRFDIMLYVTDIARSSDFYVRTLGFGVEGFWSNREHRYLPTVEEAGSDCAYVKLSAGGAGVALHEAETVAGGSGVYHFEVSDVNAYREMVAEKGGEPGGVEDFPWGWRMFFTRDPDGHILGFYASSG